MNELVLRDLEELSLLKKNDILLNTQFFLGISLYICKTLKPGHSDSVALNTLNL